MSILPASAEEVSLLKDYCTIAGLFVASMALAVNAIAAFRNVRTKKLTNYLDIVKGHRELWKLTIDNPEKYSRVLLAGIKVSVDSVTYAERKFVHLVLLHTTCAYNFTKYSDMVKIDKLSYDVAEFLSLPIPRIVWGETRKYFNSDFIAFVDLALASQNSVKVGEFLAFASPWRVLVLTAFADKVAGAFSDTNDQIILRSDSSPPIDIEYIKVNAINCIVCFGYKYRIPSDVLQYVEAINVHPSMLPLNRGPNPTVWSFLDNTPKGATIHYMNELLDGGDIIAQREIRFDGIPNLTYRKAFNHAIAEAATLLKETWPKIRAGATTRKPQTGPASLRTFADQRPFDDLFSEESLDLPIEEFCARAKRRLSMAKNRVI